VAARAGVLHDAQDLGAEGLDLGALHDRLALALHAGPQVVHLPEAVVIDGGGAGEPPVARRGQGGGGEGKGGKGHEQVSRGDGTHCRASGRKRRDEIAGPIRDRGGGVPSWRGGLGLWGDRWAPVANGGIYREATK